MSEGAPAGEAESAAKEPERPAAPAPRLPAETKKSDALPAAAAAPAAEQAPSSGEVVSLDRFRKK